MIESLVLVGLDIKRYIQNMCMYIYVCVGVGVWVCFKTLFCITAKVFNNFKYLDSEVKFVFY